jgi:hypothetical protein
MAILLNTQGLKGSEPLYVNKNGIAIHLGKIDIPQIQKFSLTGVYGINLPLHFINYPIDIIVKISNSSSEGRTSNHRTLTYDGKTKNIGVYSSDENAQSVVDGRYLLTASSQSSIVTNFSSSATSVDYSIDYILKNKTLIDHENTESDITIKTDNSDLTDISDFGTWGTEFTSTEYDNTMNYNDANSTTITDKYIVVKAENLPSTYDYLYALTNIQYIQGGSHTNAGAIIYVWNFDTSSWDNTDYSPSFSRTTIGGGPYGGTRYHPSGDVVEIGNYISGGVSYYKVSRQDGSMEVGYLGVCLFNEFLNTNTE